MQKLKPITIQRLRENNYQSKIKAIKNHKRRVQEKVNKMELERKNYSRHQAIIITSESILHAYAKSVVCMALKYNNESFMTEIPVKNGECDVLSSSMKLIIELQNNGNQKAEHDKKFNKYQYLIESGAIEDIIIFDLKDFSFDFKKDIQFICKRLGLQKSQISSRNLI